VPIIQVTLIENVFTPAQKQEMIQELTDTMVSIEGEKLRPAAVLTALNPAAPRG
jgi:4-oxalocrotonate tautomerase